MNRCTKVYSAAVSDNNFPGRYFATFGIPGQPPQWVKLGNERRSFSSVEEAELWGWRTIGAILNRSQSVQAFRAKKDPKASAYHAPGPKPNFDRYLAKDKSYPDVSSVFKKLKGDT